MKKTLWVVGILVFTLVIGGFFAYERLYPPVTVRVLTFKSVDYTGWQTYHNKTSGISIKYPPRFFVDAEKINNLYPDVNIDTTGKLTSFSILSEDFPLGAEYIPPGIGMKLLGVFEENQPLIADAPIYSKIRDLYLSDIGYVLTRKVSPMAELVSLNGKEAILREFANDDGPKADGVPYEEYSLMHKDHVFVITVIKNNPYHDGILQSIRFDD